MEFTFQYVSINTICSIKVMCSYPNLHSNMFLLIHRSSSIKTSFNVFTFQYVSINTGSRYIELLRGHLFTFQYVSINTREDSYNGRNYKIYIPICFY